MKKFKLLLLILAICSPTLSAASHYPARWDTTTKEGKKATEFYDNHKYYISPSQIHICNDGMYIDFGGDRCRVSEILEDDSGLYVHDLGFWWHCNNGHPNPPWRIRCQVKGCTG